MESTNTEEVGPYECLFPCMGLLLLICAWLQVLELTYHVVSFQLVTSEDTPQAPLPAIRRKHLHPVQPAAQLPRAPKRKVKSDATHFLPKIYESTKENSKSPVSSLNELNTLKSSESDFHTLRSSFNDFNTLRYLSDDYNTLKSSSDDFNTLNSSSDGLNTLRSSLNDFGTLKTCTSGDYSDYQWFDAKDDKSDLIDCKNILYEPNSANIKKLNIIEGQQIRIIEENSCKRIEVKAYNQDVVQLERMNEARAQAKCDQQDDDSSYEDATANIETLYSDQLGSRSTTRYATNTNSSSRREKTASGFFSFLRWFRKEKDESEEVFEDSRNEFVSRVTTATVPSSPELVRSTSSSCGSIDTLFSTATVSSFAFVSPTAYSPFGSASQPEKRIALGPDTDTYRHRIHQRDRLRELDKNLTLKRKYHLFGSEITLRSGGFTPNPSPVVERKNAEKINENKEVIAASTSNPGSCNSTGGRKKRKAPDPPAILKSNFNDSSLPNSLNKCTSNIMENGELSLVKKTRHRRTVSESAKDKRSGAYLHVKGKRKAPQPPSQTGNSEQPSTLDRLRSPFSSFSRKKRPAPQPPDTSIRNEDSKNKEETQSYQERSKSTVGQLSPEEKERLIANISKLKAHADRKSMNLSLTANNMEPIVSNDSLKLERGVLKPNKEMAKVDAASLETKQTPVSPRPWYKRSLTNKEGLSVLKRDIFKSLEKKKDRDKEKEEEWMPEVGIPRVVTGTLSSDGSSVSSTSSRFNIFSRLDRSDDKKKENEKRKSQISMLANISELDREAAEIVQKEHAREQALMAAHDARFYSYPDIPMIDQFETTFREENNENVEVPKRSSARELISLFNQIGNVTKVTVNSTFFSKDGSGFFSKEGVEKSISFVGGSVRTTEQRVIIGDNSFDQQQTTQTEQAIIIDTQSTPVGSPYIKKRSNTNDGALSEAAGISIEEISDDLEKSNRSRVMYEANKSRRHHSPSPSIPTIAEQSESASSVATTPASTLTLHPDSNKDSAICKEKTPPPSDTAADHPTAGPTAGSQQEKRVSVWSCPRCTLENPRWKITCDACGKWRPPLKDLDKAESAKSDEPFQRPSSPLHDIKKPTTNVQNIKMEMSRKVSGINWEEELQRYLPRNDVQATINIEPDNKSEMKVTPTIAVPTAPVDTKPIHAVDNASGSKNETEKSQNEKKTEPSTFIGGRLKQDNKKVTEINSINKDSPIVNGIDPKAEEPDVDEVRKARLAFFKRNTENTTDISNEDSSVSRVSTVEEANETKKKVDESEQLKLREMLKEMKNSLPKRPKHTKDSKETKMLQIFKNNSDQKDAQNLGAIKKIPQKTTKQIENVNGVSSPISNRKTEQIGSKSKLQNGFLDSDEKAEAIFITKKTIYEDIKVKKMSGSKPLKVSTSVQTSSVMKKLEQGDCKPLPGKSVDVVPVTVEEYSTTGIKGGVLYTSLKKETRRIGTGTFELIRAKDFASIEATKTNAETSVVHVYANVPSSSSDSAIQKQKANALSDTISGGVTLFDLNSQPSTPAPLTSTQEPARSKDNSKELCEVKTARPESKTGSTNQDVEKKSLSSCDESSNRGVMSTDSDSTKGAVQRSSRATSEASNYSVASVSSSDCSEVERLTAQLTLPKGIADFKADLQSALPEQNMNTLAVNRLLRRLESAIAGGQHNQAAILAKDLARLKISCSVTRQRRSLETSPAFVMVEMYVEDKVSHQGPIPLQVVPTMTVADLKLKVEQEFEIPAGVQRWILGKMLAADDTKTLQDHNVSSNGCPMFLYLVAPDGEQEGNTVATAPNSANKQDIVKTAAQSPGPPPPQLDRPGGWYYNNEDDRYSFCEDTESEITDDEAEEEKDFGDQNAAKNGNRIVSPSVEKNPSLENNRSAGSEVKEEIEEEEDEDEDEEEEEEEGDEGIVGASALIILEKPVVLQAPLTGKPFVKQPPQFVKSTVGLQTVDLPSSSKTTASAAKNAEEEERVEVRSNSQAGPSQETERKTGTLQLGWKCPACTLVNAPTRPGCAACTTERPLRYVVPVEYRANQQELQRMKKEQQLDNELQQITAEEKKKEAETQHQHYLQLVNLDKTDLVPNVEPFDCSVCLVQYDAGEGVVLRDCLHIFCRACLANTVQFNEEAEVKCPYRDADYACNSVLQEREIKALVPPKMYEQHLAKSVAQAENKIGNAFHCKTPDCRGWCIFEDNVNEFKCPVCRKTNCLTCQAIHDGVNCKQYQEQVKQASETDAEARRTKEMLEEMIVRGEAINCPTCQVVLMKKWGCDWLRCSMCKTEICWVTRGPRWGPGGKGDTTGGCQCGVNGVKCHPRCNYCH